jgi:hypothetical protein
MLTSLRPVETPDDAIVADPVGPEHPEWIGMMRPRGKR